jgi:hypothetical protein
VGIVIVHTCRKAAGIGSLVGLGTDRDSYDGTRRMSNGVKANEA